MTRSSGGNLPSSKALAGLVDELVASPKQKANNLPLLISALSSQTHKVLPVIQGLQLFFVASFERGDLHDGSQPRAAAADGAEGVYAGWLQRQYAACTAALLALLQSGADARTQLGALAALMEFARSERAGSFSNVLFSRVVSAAVTSKGAAPEVVGALLGKYGGHADVRYHTLCTLRKICESRAARAAAPGADADASSSDDEESDGDVAGSGSSAAGGVSAHDLARNVYDMLTRLPMEGGEEGAPSWCRGVESGAVAPAADADGARQRKRRKLAQQAAAADADPAAAAVPAPGAAAPLRAKWASPKLQRRAYSDAWLAFLRLSLPDDIYRKVLARLHDAVIPHLSNPLLLSDFLTHSLDKGGLVGMLALNGIFVLVTRHGLEYPRFYERLYGLLTLDAFQSKHRLRFFQLADIFLASGLVPAYTAAAFAKRFARLALRSSPAAALVAVAFVHNIVRRHPACVQLLHRAPAGGVTGVTAAGQARGEGGGEGGGEGAVWRGEDVYLEAEADPAKSRALESSLWELTALRRHANPMVANYCGILDKDLTDRRKTSEVDVSEVLAASYASLFTREAERRLKQAPAAFYACPPAALFEDIASGGDFAGWAL